MGDCQPRRPAQLPQRAAGPPGCSSRTARSPRAGPHLSGSGRRVTGSRRTQISPHGRVVLAAALEVARPVGVDGSDLTPLRVRRLGKQAVGAGIVRLLSVLVLVVEEVGLLLLGQAKRGQLLQISPQGGCASFPNSDAEELHAPSRAAAESAPGGRGRQLLRRRRRSRQLVRRRRGDGQLLRRRRRGRQQLWRRDGRRGE
jgi:hypothetical protein